MPSFHHRRLPDTSTLLSGRTPQDDFGFQSEQLQIWYNNSTEGWRDAAPHLHSESDECFVVLRGALIVEVGGERLTVGPREYCCFPRGVLHSIVEVIPPIESLLIRAPSKDDKVYRSP